MSIQANVSISVYSDYLVFEKSDCIQVIDEELLNKYSTRRLVFSDLADEDADWFEIVLDYSQRHGVRTISFMGHFIGEEILLLIDSRRQWLPNVIWNFSVNIAAKSKLDCDDYISNFRYISGEWEILPLNMYNDLIYSSYKALLPEAMRVAEFVQQNASNDVLEKIILVDNWFQDNIQYIKSCSFQENGRRYNYSGIPDNVIVPDVLCNHYGTCEDIAASIVTVLSLLGIDSDVIGGDNHAWVTVFVDKALYIWDCTHNITRNPNMIVGELKAKSYTNIYTLVGYKGDKAYSEFGPFKMPVSDCEFDRSILTRITDKLVAKKRMSTVYSDIPIYKSHKEEF